jgi:hypothetical protein
MTATRRLAAILAADVAGYSPLIGADEEGTLERLKAIRGVAEGRLERLTSPGATLVRSRLGTPDDGTIHAPSAVEAPMGPPAPSAMAHLGRSEHREGLSGT